MQKVNVPSIPRAQKVLGRAACLSTDQVGHCVKITGPKVGSLYTVAQFDPTVQGSDQGVGIITKKHSSTLCRVQFFGPMVGVYNSLLPGKRYWVGTDSQLTNVRPSPSVGGYLYLQFMGVATDSSELMLDPHIPIVLTG